MIRFTPKNVPWKLTLHTKDMYSCSTCCKWVSIYINDHNETRSAACQTNREIMCWCLAYKILNWTHIILAYEPISVLRVVCNKMNIFVCMQTKQLCDQWYQQVFGVEILRLLTGKPQSENLSPKSGSKKSLWKGFHKYWPETLYCFHSCFITGPSYCYLSVYCISFNYAVCVFK